MTSEAPSQAIQPPQRASDSDIAHSISSRDLRRAVASSFIGTMMENYDFILYATAASLVFNRIFFKNMSPEVALLASFATLAVGYFARPLGGVLFGHFGDTRGRKKMLLISLVIMGTGTMAIGLLPTPAQIGMAAPIILVLLRFLQGVAAGGEWGGAMLVALEHAPRKRRGLASGLATSGNPAGAVVATLAMGGMSLLPESQFLEWGWRVPFLSSFILIIVGVFIRLRVSETPVFKELMVAGEKKKAPLADVFATHPKAVLVALLAGISFFCSQAIMTVWGVAAAVQHNVPQTAVLGLRALGPALAVATAIIAARYSDKIGRRPVLIGAGIFGAIMAYPLLWLLTNGTLWGYALASVIGTGILQGWLFGPITSFIGEQFATRLRYTGLSLASQGASTLGAGLTPLCVSALVIAGGGQLWLVGAFWILILAISAVATLLAPEGKNVDIRNV